MIYSMERTNEVLYLYPHLSSLAISISYSELSPSDACDVLTQF
jgi:hypothetical protein